MKWLRNRDMEAFLLYVFAAIVISVRFVTEIVASDLHSDLPWLFFHHQLWFYAVVTMFLIVFRYIVRLRTKNLSFLLLASPIILIPIAVHWIFGERVMRLDYLSLKDISSFFFNIVTFMWFNSQNKPVSFELILLFFGVFFLGSYLSRSLWRGIAAALISYLWLMLVHGTVLIAPEAFSVAAMRYSSHLQPDIAFASIYFSVFLFYLFLLFLPEIKRYIFPLWNWKIGLVWLFLFVAFYAVFLFYPPMRFDQPPTIQDLIVLWIHPFVIGVFFLVLFGRFLGVKLFSGMLAFISIIMLMLIFHPEWESNDAGASNLPGAKKKPKIYYDVVVVGGGIAGLDAASRLKGFNTLVLEYTSKLGNRVYTKKKLGVVYELGASVFHDLSLLPFSPNDVRIVEDLSLVGVFAQHKVWLASTPLAVMKQLPSLNKDATRLTLLANGNYQLFSSLGTDAQEMVSLFFNAAYSGKISRYAQEFIPSAFNTIDVARVKGGAGRLVELYRKQISGAVFVNSTVISVEDLGHEVKVVYRHGEEIQTVYAFAVVMATPASDVLQTVKNINSKATALLQSISYGSAMVVVLAVHGNHIPPFHTMVTPQQPFGLVIQSSTYRENTRLLTVYYFDEWLKTHKIVTDTEIVQLTIRQVAEMGLISADNILFSDSKRWNRWSPIINSTAYTLLSNDVLHLSPRVILAGDYTIVPAASYNIKADVQSGKRAAQLVRSFLETSQ